MPVFPGRLFRSAAVRAATVASAVAIVASTPAPVTADSPMYALTDLGSLGCCNWWIWESSALGLNNAGEVVGVTTSPTDPTVMLPFIYRNGQMTALTDWAGEARAINDAGVVTGAARPPGEIMPHLFGYQDGVFMDLGALPGYSNQPYAAGYAINSNGTMVGDSKDGAFIYENGSLRLLKRLSARYASGVNDYGDVIGLLETVRGDGRHTNKTFLFSGNSLIDIGTMDGNPDSQTTPGGINNRGQITGTAWMQTQARAFLWENGVFHDVGALRGGYSYGMGLNNRGDVVGFSDTSVFVYRDGVMIDLNEAVVRTGSIWPRIQDVYAINDNGQIVGNAYIEDAAGVVHLRACLLTPVF